MLYLLVCNRRVGKLCKKVQGVGRMGKIQSENIMHAYIVLFRISNFCQHHAALVSHYLFNRMIYMGILASQYKEPILNTCIRVPDQVVRKRHSLSRRTG